MNDRWTKLFSLPGQERDLDVCRILFYLMIFGWFWNNHFESYAGVPRELYLPPLIPRVLGFPAPEMPWILTLRYLWLISLLLSALGFLTRFSTAVAFLLGTYLLSLDWSFGNTHHSHHLIVACLGALALARPAQYFSLDELWARRRGQSQPRSDETWCLRVCQLCWCLMFFNAGLSKLRHSGLEFFSGENFQHIMLITHGWYARTPYPLHETLRMGVFNSPTLAGFLAGAGMVVELLVPLAFFRSGKVRWMLVGGICALQVGAFLLFYISEFKKMSPAYLFWIPWSCWAAHLRRRAQ